MTDEQGQRASSVGLSVPTSVAPRTWRTVVRDRRLWPAFVLWPASILLLYAVARGNYLLFHSVVETAAVCVGVLLFVTTRRLFPLTGNSFLTFLGVGFFWAAAVDFIHVLAYKGMGVFPGGGANLPTQLWIVARALEALVLVVSPVFLVRRLRWTRMFVLVGAIAGAGVFAVFAGWFPACFVDGQGLTSFKVGAEYAISAVLIGALVHLRVRGHAIDSWSRRAVSVVIVVTILSELSFTLYTDVYGISNFIGHVFKFIAFVGLYQLVLRNMLSRPVHALTELVPICAGCKSIRDPSGGWRPLESFFGETTGAVFSHGLCPTCLERYEEELGAAP